jgi:hypothetical protein
MTGIIRLPKVLRLWYTSLVWNGKVSYSSVDFFNLFGSILVVLCIQNHLGTQSSMNQSVNRDPNFERCIYLSSWTMVVILDIPQMATPMIISHMCQHFKWEEIIVDRAGQIMITQYWIEVITMKMSYNQMLQEIIGSGYMPPKKPSNRRIGSQSRRTASACKRTGSRVTAD